MADTKILEDLVSTLKRLETRLDSQDNRLGSIEVSLRSAGASSAAGASSMVASDLDSAASPLAASPQTTYTTASLYKASLVELRNRFEFADLSCSDIDNEDHRPREVAYTESVYSRPLPRLGVGGLAETYRPSEPPLSDNPRLSAHERGSSSRSVQSEESSDDRSDFHRLATRPLGRRASRRVEMALYAWEEFKQSLQSSWRLPSSSRKASSVESKTLAELSNAPVAAGPRWKVFLKTSPFIMDMFCWANGPWGKRVDMIA